MIGSRERIGIEETRSTIEKLPPPHSRQVWTSTTELKGERNRIPPFGDVLMIYTIPRGHRLLLKNVSCSAISERDLPSNAWHKIRVISTRGLLCEKSFLGHADISFDPPQIIDQNQDLYIHIRNNSSEFIESIVNIAGILERKRRISEASAEVRKWFWYFLSAITLAIRLLLGKLLRKLLSVLQRGVKR